MQYRTTFSCSVAAAAAAGFAALTYIGAAQAAEIKLAHLAPTDDPRHLTLQEFAKAVEDRTGGALKLKIYPNSTLGKEREVIEQQKAGLTELALNGDLMANFFKPWSVINLPYMWRDQDHIEKFLASDLCKKWVKETADTVNVEIIGFFARNPRILTTRNKPINKVEDLKGLKIRVPNGEVYMETWKAFGVQPAPMATSEFILALKTGTVDGMENPIEVMYTWKIYEIAKYLSLTNHMQTRLFFSGSKKYLDSLPPEQRKIILEEGANAQKRHFQRILDMEADLEKAIAEKGMTIVKNPDISGFVAASQQVHERFMDAIGRANYEAIKKM